MNESNLLYLFSSTYAAIFLYTAVLIFAYKKIAKKMNFLDHPNNRSSHNQPVPLGAGVVFFIVFIPAVAVLYYFELIGLRLFTVFTVGSFVYTLLGFADDLLTLSVAKRLIPQFIVASWIVIQLTNFLSVPLNIDFLPIDSAYLSFLFSIFYITWMVNLYNFMDGIDGFLGTNVFFYSILSFALCFYQGNLSFGLIYLVLAFIIFPFLFFNWRPAKVFMGDAGAYFLGFFFAVLSLVGKIDFDLSFVAPVILMGALICDSTLTLIFRFISTGKIFQGHRTHGFQRLRIDLQLRTTRVVSIYVAVTVFWFFPLSILAAAVPKSAVMICFLSYLPVVLIGIFVLKVGQEGKTCASLKRR